MAEDKGEHRLADIGNGVGPFKIDRDTSSDHRAEAAK